MVECCAIEGLEGKELEETRRTNGRLWEKGLQMLYIRRRTEDVN